MKKKLLSRDKELLGEKYLKRKKLMWECVRRNKDYIRDFELFEKGTLNDLQKLPLAVKWHILAEITTDPVWSLADPKEPIPISKIHGNEGYYYPEPDIPQSLASYYTGHNPRWDINIFRPGEVLVSLKGGKESETKFEDWKIQRGKGEFEKLTKENCPHWISILIEVQPFFSKSAIETGLMARFEETYDLLKDAQEAVLKKKSLGPRDDDEFQKFMTAFDYKEKNAGITLNDIAVRMFPDATYENKKGKKHALPSAIDNVRYYLKRADYYINKQGWKML